MTASKCIQSLIISLYLLGSGVAGDHYHGYEPAYVYPENSYKYPDNTSLDTYSYATRSSPRTRRVFDAGYALDVSLSLDASIPLPEFSSAIYVSVPFSFSFPEASTTGTGTAGRSFSGLGSTSSSPRTALYTNIEKYLGQMIGADGHQCLLRAMCEASSTPLHDEGILGDAVTFLLTSNYAAEESDERFKKYFAAQAKGQLTGECTEWHSKCPISLFKFIDDNLV